MKKKILVAEDDSNIRSGLLDALEADGHEAEGFPDGASAIAAFRQDKWDLLLLDIMMPEKSGYEVARRSGRPVRKFPSSCLRPRARKSTRCSVSKWAPTIT